MEIGAIIQCKPKKQGYERSWFEEKSSHDNWFLLFWGFTDLPALVYTALFSTWVQMGRHMGATKLSLHLCTFFVEREKQLPITLILEMFIVRCIKDLELLQEFKLTYANESKLINDSLRQFIQGSSLLNREYFWAFRILSVMWKHL